MRGGVVFQKKKSWCGILQVELLLHHWLISILMPPSDIFLHKTLQFLSTVGRNAFFNKARARAEWTLMAELFMFYHQLLVSRSGNQVFKGAWSSWIHLALDARWVLSSFVNLVIAFLNESCWTKVGFLFLNLCPKMVFSMEMLGIYAFSYLLSVSKVHLSLAGVLKLIFAEARALLSLHVAPSLCSTLWLL